MSLRETTSDQPSKDTGCTSLGLFSRRAFFGLGAVVGALTFVGATPDGRVQAWADETGTKFFTIYILSKEEVPIMVYDLSGTEPKPLGGATVTLKSAEDAERPALTVVTRDTGFAPANIKSISRQHDWEDQKLCNLYGSIALKKDGYEEFFVESVFIEAGTPCDKNGNRPNTIVLFTRPLKGKPYIRQFTIDGDDVQYSLSGDAAAVWDGNESNHDLTVEIAALAAGADVTVSVLINGANKASKTVKSDSAAPHLAKATFTDKWLKLIKVGDKLGVSYKVGNGDTHTFTSPAAFKAPLVTSTARTMSTSYQISPGVEKDQQKEVKFVKWLNRPGDSMACALPFLPITIFTDSKGRFGVAATLGQFTFFKKERGEDPTVEEGKSLFDTFNRESMSKAWEDWKDRFQQNRESFDGLFHDACKNPKDMTWDTIPAKFTYSIGLDAKLDAMGYGYILPDGDGREWCWDMGLRAGLTGSFSWAMQSLVAGVPLIIGLDGTVSVSYSIMYGMKSKKMWDLVIPGMNIICDFKNGAKNPLYMTVLIYMDIGPTVSVGAMGIFSVGVRGYAYLKIDIDFYPRKNLPCPHQVVNIGACIDVILQILFFSKTYNVHSWGPWAGYDNWKSNESNDSPNGVSNLELGDDELDYNTDEDLAASCEAYAKWEEGEVSYAPVYEQIASLAGDEEIPLPLVYDLLNIDASQSAYSAMCGALPVTQKLLYQDCYSNPRLRIVHTDTCSFKNDRAFMVRVVTAKVEVPKKTTNFASQVVYCNGEEVPEGSDLAVETCYGSHFAVPSNGPADANAPTSVERMRIAVSEWDREHHTWGKADIIDFVVMGEVLELDRLNSYDVDFDVELYNGNLLIAITSMQRPKSERPTYLECESRQYLSLVRWDIDQKKVTSAGSTFSLNSSGLSLFHPRILMQNFDQGDGRASLHAVVYSYACKYTEDKKYRTAGYLAATVFDDMQTPGWSGHRFSTPTTIVPNALKSIRSSELVVGTFEVACPDRLVSELDPTTNRYETMAIFSWSHPKTKSYPCRSFVFCETFSIVAEESGGVTTYKSQVNQRSSLQLNMIPSVTKLGVSKQQALYAFSDFSVPGNTKDLKVITFNPKTYALEIMDEATQTDKTQYFASFNGRRLYCVRVIDGEEPATAAGTIEAVQNGARLCAPDGAYNLPRSKEKLSASPTKVKLYQLCEARWVDEIQNYYDFYPIAQLQWVPDSIGVICAAKDFTHFTMANISKIEENTANIYQVDVPVVLSAVALKAFPLAPFAAEGDTCWYAIEIHNAGNAPITSITMEASLNGAVFETTEFNDLAKHVIDDKKSKKVKFAATEGLDEDEFDPGVVEVDDDGNVCAESVPDKVTIAGALWPGKRRTYCFGFKVPKGKGLHGDTTFGVRISKVADHMDDNSLVWPEEVLVPEVEAIDGISLFADNDYLYGSELMATEPVTALEGAQLEGAGSVANDAEMLSRSPYEFEVEYAGDEVGYEFDIEVGEYADGENGSGSGNGSVASTGDGATGAIASAAAVAALAAGAAAAARKKFSKAVGDDEDGVSGNRS